VTGPAHREYAGIVSRAVAYVTDALVVTVVALGATVVVVLVGAAVSLRTPDLARAVVPVLVVLLPAVLAAYSWVFWALAGRTPGMTLLGVRVVRVDGGQVSWPAALIRAVVLAFFPVGALWLLVDRRAQGVHDKLARTTVVRVVDAAAAPRLGEGAVSEGALRVAG